MGNIINVAVVEDEEKTFQLLNEYLLKFAKEKDIQFNVVHFSDGLNFINNYKSVYDLVFMDIEMPNLNGIETSKKLRLIDSNVILIFVTNLAQYAVNGYEVDALDFVVKPISYYVMSLKLIRAIAKIQSNKKLDSNELDIGMEGSIYRIKYSDIKYIEVLGHKLIFHTINGNHPCYGTLKKYEELLEKFNFKRCNHCFLVNLKYINSVVGNTAEVEGEILQISRTKRKDFINALNIYMGRGL